MQIKRLYKKMKLSLAKRLLSSYVAKHGPIMKSHLIRVVVQIQSIRVRFSKGCDELAETIRDLQGAVKQIHLSAAQAAEAQVRGEPQIIRKCKKIV